MKISRFHWRARKVYIKQHSHIYLKCNFLQVTLKLQWTLWLQSEIVWNPLNAVWWFQGLCRKAVPPSVLWGPAWLLHTPGILQVTAANIFSDISELSGSSLLVGICHKSSATREKDKKLHKLQESQQFQDLWHCYFYNISVIIHFSVPSRRLCCSSHLLNATSYIEDHLNSKK